MTEHEDRAIGPYDEEDEDVAKQVRQEDELKMARRLAYAQQLLSEMPKLRQIMWGVHVTAATGDYTDGVWPPELKVINERTEPVIVDWVDSKGEVISAAIKIPFDQIRGKGQLQKAMKQAEEKYP